MDGEINPNKGSVNKDNEFGGIIMKTMNLKAFVGILIAAMVLTGTPVANIINVPSRVRAASDEDIYLNKSSMRILVGKSKVLRLVNSNVNPKFSTSNRRVATITAKGKVKARKPGTAVITVKAGDKTYTCKVTVLSYMMPDLSSIIMSEDEELHVTLRGSCYGRIFYRLKDKGVVKTDSIWDSDDRELTVYLDGIEDGETEIILTNNYNREVLVIPVTVTGLSDEYESEEDIETSKRESEKKTDDENKEKPGDQGGAKTNDDSQTNSESGDEKNNETSGENFSSESGSTQETPQTK